MIHSRIRFHVARGLFAAVLAVVSMLGRAQAPVDHWEAVVQDGTMWKYLIPTFQLVGYWMSGNFADNTWDEGPAGFGYGDGDDENGLYSMVISSWPS